MLTNDFDISESDSYSDSPTPKNEGDREEELVIAKSETANVRRLKLVVFAVLVLSAVSVAVTIFLYTSGSERKQFELEFNGHSNKVLEGMGTSLEKTLGALDALQTHLVSRARETNQSWPFVTVPDFAVQATKLRLLSDSIYVVVSPLVTKDQRLEWEAYSLENQFWVNESMNVQAKDEFYYGPVMYNHSIYGVIHNDFGDTPYDTPLMVPWWQASPVVTTTPAFNWNLLAMVDPEPVVRSLSARRVVFSKTYGLPDVTNEDEIAEFEIWRDWLRDYVPPDEDPGEPCNDILYPIVDSDLTSLRIEDSGDPKVVGVLNAGFYWRDLIKGLLPIGSDGVVVVFSSKCSPDFTYQIDGPKTTFLGRGDLHERKFDSYGVGSSLHELGSSFAIRKSQYTGLPLDTEFCPFSVKVYPSTAMQVKYMTSNPMWITIGAVLIFVFTSAVFLLYDFTVEQRQRKVMTTAVRTNAIVSSLFPSVVRDRIYPTNSDASVSEKSTRSRLRNTRVRLTTFLKEGTLDLTDDMESGTKLTTPVAELFPEATVFFADLVGFTAWSSTREPTQVFTLLEALYGAFDSIARRRGVFKVETIGDCYVAVCGLPEPRSDHAVVMVRFARDCRDKMMELVCELKETLGPDTGQLKLRIGLNSGPVTAGVLRGDRARFQLFGDTVNCASRMETNSKPNMIHVSEFTADLLRKAGKEQWLTKRSELIQAKGKGTLQTYWVDASCNVAFPDNGVCTSENDTSSNEHDTLHVPQLDKPKSLSSETFLYGEFDTPPARDNIVIEEPVDEHVPQLQYSTSSSSSSSYNLSIADHEEEVYVDV